MDWSRVRPLLERILSLPAERRAAELERCCPDDPALQERLRALLAAGRDHTDLFESPPARIPDEPRNGSRGVAPSALGPGDFVGAWRLERLLGAGGMGAVWLAEREGADFRQRAAVKIVKRGLDTDEVLRRFRRERRVLAELDHPNVPHFVDGGATADGRPFLVMEYVDGQPIDEYARAAKLDLRARVELMLRVCGVVQHAHEHGVVHRDLKPSNVLVTSDDLPKLLDFGIAKVLARDDGSETFDLTLTGQQLLTPRYASPEQVRGELVGPTTDVYALGLLLWELLVEAPALALDALTRKDLEEAICERPIPRPSRAVDATRTDLRRELAGDLDTICQMALRKEADRRYASARQFAEDLQRYLGGQRVLARPDTMTYRTSRFVRRNRALVAGSLSTILVLAVGLVVALWLYRGSERERARAEQVAYAASLDAAAAALREGLVSEAAQRLQEAPRALRGWEWRHFSSRLDRASSVRSEPTMCLYNDVDVTSDGTRRVSTLSMRVEVEGPRGATVTVEAAVRPTGVAWSSDGVRLGWCDRSGAVWTWRPSEGPAAATCLVPGEEEPWDDGADEGLALDVAWRPDREELAVLFSDGSVVLFDATDGGELASFHEHEPGLMGKLAWHPDGRRLASGGWDEHVYVYDVGGDEESTGWHAHSMVVEDLDFDPSGRFLATTSLDQTVRVWDVATRKVVSTQSLSDRVSSLRFLTQERLALGYGRGAIEVRSWRTWELEGRLLGHPSPVLALAASAPGDRIVSVDRSGFARSWDSTVQDVRAVRTCEFSNAIAPDLAGRRFAAASPDGLVRLWSLEPGALEPQRVLDAERGFALDVAFFSDGERLAAAYERGAVIWEVETGRLLRELTDRYTSALAVSPDGEQVATVHPEKTKATFSCREAASGRLVRELSVPVEWSQRGWITFDENGSLEAACVTQRCLMLFGEEGMRVLEGPYEAGDHPLGQRELLVAANRECFWVDLATGAKTRALRVGRDIRSLALHPSGTRVALGLSDRIEIWDPHVPARVATLSGAAGPVNDMAWTVDGETLLSIDHGGWIRVWETR